MFHASPGMQSGSDCCSRRQGPGQLDGLRLIEPFAGAIAAPIGQESERLDRDFCFAQQSVTRALPSLIRAPHTAASPRSSRRLIAKPPESSLRSGPAVSRGPIRSIEAAATSPIHHSAEQSVASRLLLILKGGTPGRRCCIARANQQSADRPRAAPRRPFRRRAGLDRDNCSRAGTVSLRCHAPRPRAREKDVRAAVPWSGLEVRYPAMSIAPPASLRCLRR